MSFRPYSADMMEKSYVPPHRVVQREVIDWANSLNGRAPVGDDLSRLIASLAAAVEADRRFTLSMMSRKSR